MSEHSKRNGLKYKILNISVTQHDYECFATLAFHKYERYKLRYGPLYVFKSNPLIMISFALKQNK